MTVAVVTGGAGFIGSSLVDRLLEVRGLALGGNQSCSLVVAVDNLSSGRIENLRSAMCFPQRFSFVQGHVQSPLGICPDVIFNLACPASPSFYHANPQGTFETCVLGALSLLKVLEHSRYTTLVQASSSEVYGDADVDPQPEDYWGRVNPIGERACYDEGKRAAETLLMDARRVRGADTRIVRIFNTYGPRMRLDDGRVVPNFIRQALLGEPLTIYGSGEQTRSFCYVSDLVEGLVRAATIPVPRGAPVNLGNPAECCTVMELAGLVLEETGSKSSLIHLPLPSDDPKQRRPDISRAREILKWEPKVTLRDGLRRMIDAFDQKLALGAEK